MKEQGKINYEAPSTLIFEVMTEGVVCTSQGQAGVQDYNWNNVVIE